MWQDKSTVSVGFDSPTCLTLEGGFARNFSFLNAGLDYRGRMLGSERAGIGCGGEASQGNLGS